MKDPMNLVTRPVAELQGPALDWAVASATRAWEAAHPSTVFRGVSNGTRTFGCVVLIPRNPFDDPQEFCPSTKWEYGGRLIEKYSLEFEQIATGTWRAETTSRHSGFGPTHLIAACRAIVASVLGDTVQVPEELTL